MRLSDVRDIIMPEGEVLRIKIGDTLIWIRADSYVSLGDSIAAGHTIDENWARDYGEGSQYGKNGNTSTVIVPNSYTDIIRSQLVAEYGADHTEAVSFARSGDKVKDLIEKLDHSAVREALEKATLVTVCIGANDILGPAMNSLEGYIANGNPALATLGAEIDANLSVLNTDSNPNSYKALFDKLKSINPNARYLFMSIYNPIKYLWLETGSNGFFKPLLDTIPNMDLDVDGAVESMFGLDDLAYYDITKFQWVAIELNYDLDQAIKNGLLSTSIVQMLFNRVNGLGDWVESYITRLNQVLKSKIDAAGPNFAFVDAKAAFDEIPDRPVSAPYHYNDLVSVEFTRGYDTAQMDWGALWVGSDAGTYWWNLASRYTSFNNALPSLNVDDYVSFDMEGFAAELVTDIVEKVIVPDIDPHPEPYGHQVLAEVFGEVIEA